MRRALPVLLVVAVAGCDRIKAIDPTIEPHEGCAVGPDAGGGISIMQTTGQSIPATSDTLVRGTTSNRPGDVTISKVEIAGVVATNDANDYASFEATIPFTTLQSLAISANTPSFASLPVIVTTNCSSPATTSFTVPVVPRAASALTLSQPNPVLIPANGAAAAELVITADAADVGVVVALTTTLGALDGAPTENVVLAGPPPPTQPVAPPDAMEATPVTASVTLQGTGKAGVAVVTARSTNTEPKTVNAILFGPPVIDPSGTTLDPGTSNTITVNDPGNTGGVTCTFTQGAKLTLSGVFPQYTVKADPAASATTATLTCMDPFNQTTVATYTVPKQ